jgi:hypothetical protein
MCHGKYRRYDERMERERGRRLWDLFDRETRDAPPAEPVVERDREPGREREEVLTGAPARSNDEH